jgi:hypothetical protein
MGRIVVDDVADLIELLRREDLIGCHRSYTRRCEGARVAKQVSKRKTRRPHRESGLRLRLNPGAQNPTGLIAHDRTAAMRRHGVRGMCEFENIFN